MASPRNVILKGASGKDYKFEVYPYDTTFNALAAVYYISQRKVNADGKGTHTSIYIGQTSNLAERFDEHHDEACFRKYEANCKSILLENSEEKRLAIEADLIGAHKTLCNG